MPQPQRFCKRCGSQLPLGADRCPSCGEPVRPAGAVAPKPIRTGIADPGEHKASVWAVGAVCAVVLAIVGLGTHLLLGTGVDVPSSPEPAVVTLQVTATYDGDWSGRSFSFALEGEGDSPMPDAGSSTATASLASRTAAFGPISYTKAGTYTYTIREDLPDGVGEDSPSADEIAYETAGHRATVTVTQEGGKLVANVTYDDGAEELVVGHRASTDVSVTLVWDDSDDEDGLRPDSVEVQLYANGAPVGDPVPLGADSGWAFAWSALDRYADGTALVYTVEEPAVPNGYTLASGGSAVTGYILTNTHQTERERLRATQEGQFHEALMAYYEALPGYSQRIAEQAACFNADYASQDLALRQSHHADSSVLMKELSDGRASLAALGKPADTEWGTQYDQVLQCYDYNITRLQCIVDAWAVSISYQDPKAHQEEILAPIVAASDGSGNVAKANYDALYPQIAL